MPKKIVKKKKGKKAKKAAKAEKAEVVEVAEEPVEEVVENPEEEQAEGVTPVFAGNVEIKGDGELADSLREMTQEQVRTAELLQELEKQTPEDAIEKTIEIRRAPLTRWTLRYELRARVGRRLVVVTEDEARLLKEDGTKVVPTIGHGPEGGPTKVFLVITNVDQADVAIEAAKAIKDWHIDYGNENWRFSPGTEIDKALEELKDLMDRKQRGPQDWAFFSRRVSPGIHEWRGILVTRDRTPVTLEEAKDIGVAVYTAISYGVETKRGYDIRIENAECADELIDLLEMTKEYLSGE